MNRFAVFIAALLALSSTRAVAAVDTSADALVARGLELRRQGKTAEALELFARAHAIAPSPRTSGQMGLAEASLQHWLDAEKHLNSSLASSEDSWVRKNKSLLEQAIDLTHKHVGHVSITGPTGAQVSIAGNVIGTLPIPAPIRAPEGALLLTAIGPGYKQLTQTVNVPGGGRVSVTLVLEPLDVRAAAPSAQPVVPLQHVDSGESHWRPWTAGALFAVGAAAIAWGAIWVAVDGNDSCGDGPTCHDVYNTRKPGWVILGVGAAAAVSGGVVLFTAHRGDSEVGLAASAAGLRLAGRF
jgi:hypothetical protein